MIALICSILCVVCFFAGMAAGWEAHKHKKQWNAGRWIR